MGKKSSRRKTRWRTLSIGAPPGEEDEEDGLRNGYVKSKDNDPTSQGFEANRQASDYKSRKSSSSDYSSGYASGASRSRKDAEDSSSGSPSQPKIIFNEDEYTRITTPRQDVLFKKGYLSRKKAWPGNASTSATPSTTESQSASHSTADGSEMNEDQQLLDSGSAECPHGVEPQLGYGTFYDHTSGYCYEYPIMLVGPAPIPAQVGPSVLAAVPCGSVPLRPIEWINPAFVPKLSDQSYCMMNYRQDAQNSSEAPPLTDEQETPATITENANGTWNGESGTGSASCSGSLVEEAEDRVSTEEVQVTKEAVTEEIHTDEYLETEPQRAEGSEMVASGGGLYVEPLIVPQQPMHVPHVIHAVPQPYMYPGHYMFGPPLINVNGFTVQGVPMIRSTEVTSTAAIYAKRRKKKKRRKQRRLVSGNPEDDEEYYSSEGESALSSSRLDWSTTASSADAPTTATSTTNRPLNPECQEFHLRPIVELENSDGTVISNSEHQASSSFNERVPLEEGKDDSTPTAEESHQSDQQTEQLNEQLTEKPQQSPREQSPHVEKTRTGGDGDDDEALENEQRLMNGETSSNEKDSEQREKGTKSASKKKYTPKGQKFTREATPGPKTSTKEMDARSDSLVSHHEEVLGEQVRADLEEDSNGDSGFETQTHHGGYRITEAVTEWLRTVNSPDIFITSTARTDSDVSTDDDDEDEEEPAKNLLGNPTLALSANGGVGDGLASSCAATCGEFAKINKVSDDKEVKGEGKCMKRRLERDAKSDSSDSSPPNVSSVRTVRRRNLPRNEVVTGVCEFTAKDSVAGVRVALNSRMNTKGSSSRFVAEDTDGLRTFEKGEIVVSASGKLMPVCQTMPISEESAKATENESQKQQEDLTSLGIEEADVLECWEAETIEPIRTPRKVMQSRGTACDGEATEDDAIGTKDATILKHVQRYYRLGETEYATSVEEETPITEYTTVPNSPVEVMRGLHGEEISVVMPNDKNSEILEEKEQKQQQQHQRIPIDEAFEVYESCYTGKMQSLLNLEPTLAKARTLYTGANSEAPIPCRAVCCSIQ